MQGERVTDIVWMRGSLRQREKVAKCKAKIDEKLDE